MIVLEFKKARIKLIAPNHINEKSAGVIAFELYDSDNLAWIPTTLEYQIDDITTGAAIKTATSLTPASSGEIDLVPADTTLQSQDNAVEYRRVTVTADSGLDTQQIEKISFDVFNLRAVT